jgi:ABC-type phosphate transport system substrate-binding protein
VPSYNELENSKMKTGPHRAVAVAACTALWSTAWAETVRIAGATTVLNVVVNPTRAAVEKSSGHTLQIAASNTGKGLVELSEGPDQRETGSGAG